MSVDANKDLIRRLIEIPLSGNLDLLDSYYAGDYVDHSAWKDLGGLKQTIAAFQAASPDLKLVLEDMIAEEDKVTACAKVIGTRDGEIRTISLIAIYRIANGKIVEHWGHSDSFF